MRNSRTIVGVSAIIVLLAIAGVCFFLYQNSEKSTVSSPSFADIKLPSVSSSSSSSSISSTPLLPKTTTNSAPFAAKPLPVVPAASRQTSSLLVRWAPVAIGVFIVVILFVRILTPTTVPKDTIGELMKNPTMLLSSSVAFAILGIGIAYYFFLSTTATTSPSFILGKVGSFYPFGFLRRVHTIRGIGFIVSLMNWISFFSYYASPSLLIIGAILLYKFYRGQPYDDIFFVRHYIITGAFAGFIFLCALDLRQNLLDTLVSTIGFIGTFSLIWLAILYLLGQGYTPQYLGSYVGNRMPAGPMVWVNWVLSFLPRRLRRMRWASSGSSSSGASSSTASSNAPSQSGLQRRRRNRIPSPPPSTVPSNAPSQSVWRRRRNRIPSPPPSNASSNAPSQSGSQRRNRAPSSSSSLPPNNYNPNQNSN